MHSLILALNPSIDAEWQMRDVVWEEKNDVQSERRWAGGKGVNVARWLKYLGGAPLLLLPLGGRNGAELAMHLKREKLSAKIIRLRGSTRVNVIVTTALRRQMRFNAPAPRWSPLEWRALQEAAERARNGAALQILSGSLPRGVPADAYARMVKRASSAGVRTLVDCDGSALDAAVRARPFLVKPNAHELAQWWGKPMRSHAAVKRAARALSETTGGWVFVSRGGQPAMLLNHAERFLVTARPPAIQPRNTVGAGDALLAAVAWQIAAGSSPEQWLRWGVAAGSAATGCIAGELPPKTRVQAIFARVMLE